MDYNFLEDTRTPEFWMNDYWNMWWPLSVRIHKSRKTGDTTWLRNNPALTFLEFIPSRVCYKECQCDLNIIPSIFIRNTNRFVGLYNGLISQENINLDKMDRIIYLASWEIYMR